MGKQRQLSKQGSWTCLVPKSRSCGLDPTTRRRATKYCQLKSNPWTCKLVTSSLLQCLPPYWKDANFDGANARAFNTMPVMFVGFLLSLSVSWLPTKGIALIPEDPSLHLGLFTGTLTTPWGISFRQNGLLESSCKVVVSKSFHCPLSIHHWTTGGDGTRAANLCRRLYKYAVRLGPASPIHTILASLFSHLHA